MADVITRLKIESGEYDSKIKRAVSGLQNMEQECRRVNGTLAILEKDQKQYVQSLGQMQTVSNTVRGKIGELTSAYVELSSQYKRLTEEEKKGDFGKALSSSLEQIKQRAQAAKQELSDIQKELDGSGIDSSGDSIFSKMGGKLGGAMSVFAGNLMTKATMEVANLGSEMAEMVKQGVEMAKAGEGIRIAFERLGNGQILDGLREATHGTVTDIELMKAAVKFNDFKLPIEELGTMLAFAQQKAKDTGQSVDYMVDSIVTGLGRKSLMILDNLGLSATEIKDKMAETGDMTKAVGAIIREQMQKAGDYVETAADRAAQANVDLQNKLEELGRKFLPVQEASNQLWTSMKIGILDIVSGPLARLLNGLTEAGRLRNQMNDMAGGNSSSETEKQLNFLRNTSEGNRRKRYDRQISIYEEQEALERQRADRARRNLASLKNAKPGTYDAETYAAQKQLYESEIAGATQKANAWQMFRLNYQRGAQGILNPAGNTTVSDTTPPKTGGTGSSGTSGKTTVKDVYVPAEGSIDAQVEKVRELTKQWSAATDQAGRDGYKKQLDEAQGILDQMRGKVKTVTQEMSTGISGLTPDMIKWGENDIKQQMQSVEYGTQEYNDLAQRLIDYNSVSNLMQEAVKTGLEVDDSVKEYFVDALTGPLGEKIPQELYDSLVESLNDFKEYTGDNPIELDAKTGNVNEKKTEKKEDDTLKETQKVVSGLSQVASGLQAMGIMLPSEVTKVLSMLQGAMTVVQGVGTIISVFGSTSEAANTAAVGANTGALIANTAAMVALQAAMEVNTASNFIPFFAEGGVVHAAGGVVAGTTFSGDQIPAMLNAGEVVLNRAQVGNLAEQLEDNDNFSGFGGTPYVTGEQIYLGLNNYLKGTGLGQIVTSQG